MAVVFCTDLESVKVQAYGKWFEFKPGQVKQMQDHIGDFLCFNRKDKGFVSLPETYLEAPDSPENKKLKEDATLEGRKQIVGELRKLRQNFEVSTQRDIDVAGEKRSYLTELQPGHKEMYRRLALFKNAEADSASKDEEDVKRYMEQIDGTASRPVAAKASQRS